jgi:hypothetical protein
MTISNMARPTRWASLLSAVAVVALTACGNDSATAPQQVAKENLNAPVTQATVALLSSTTVSLPGAGAAFGAATAGQNVTIAFGATGLTTAVTVGANQFDATLSFGSCRFTVLAVRSGVGFTIGQVITANPCNFVIPTAGKLVGAEFSSSFNLQFGQFLSQPLSGSFKIDSNGFVEGRDRDGRPVLVGRVTTGNPT